MSKKKISCSLELVKVSKCFLNEIFHKESTDRFVFDLSLTCIYTSWWLGNYQHLKGVSFITSWLYFSFAAKNWVWVKFYSLDSNSISWSHIISIFCSFASLRQWRMMSFLWDTSCFSIGLEKVLMFQVCPSSWF